MRIDMLVLRGVGTLAYARPAIELPRGCLLLDYDRIGTRPGRRSHALSGGALDVVFARPLLGRVLFSVLPCRLAANGPIRIDDFCAVCGNLVDIRLS